MWTLPKPGYRDGAEEQIAVNVGGVRLALRGDMLDRYPESRLAELARSTTRGFDAISSLCDDYEPAKGEFYFDRDPDSFKCIVEVYYFGEVHMKKGICPMCFMKEMEFWRIDSSCLDECCKSNVREKEEELAEIADKVKAILDDLDLDGGPLATRSERIRKFLWRLMEKPESSWVARAIAVASFLFVLTSSLVMCLATLPELQVQDADGHVAEHPTLDAIETACVCWFTLEYGLRFASAPEKTRFVLSFLNMVDLAAIAPFYIVLALTHLGATAAMDLTDVQRAVQALRVMRVARILKLARHSSGLQTLTYALRRSFAELGLLLTYMGVGIFVFSALGYTMEHSHPETLFRSIPHSFWWAIITMTTVGYGDVYPKTALGRCNAALSFLCGVVAIALPVHPIINNFVVYYNKQKVLETAARHKLELMELHGTLGQGTDKHQTLRVSRSDSHIAMLTGERRTVKKRSVS
ncbi:potassium voltage-gated channel subfamily F member 1 [Ictalurus punctatus]|uniref:Potassium voltage-gated channel subfamily F member 1 n=1 Tax=Ictalurus punctatus TaxID=7998 RepID=W5UBX1_ICTPU|nr:potassium voltage-gated channel subfamily F member 1 [Ictalurus punctatus]